MKVRAACVAIGLAGMGAGPARGDAPRATGGAGVRGQAGAAIGLGSFDGTYEPDFGALVLTAHGGALYGRGVGIALGVRVMYFHGGETNEARLVPEYEMTRVPVLLTPRVQGRYGFVELGIGTTPTWIVDGQGQTRRGPSHETAAFTVGLTSSDPTLRYHPELVGGAVLIGDGRLLWIGAGLSWW
ncbi:MAG: hypothetical protein IPH44_37905 [Myxococcales bacterium]|nr:hypothetical protein [Myxococcales bacterium]